MAAPFRQIKNGHQSAPLKGVDQCPQALRLGLIYKKCEIPLVFLKSMDYDIKVKVVSPTT